MHAHIEPDNAPHKAGALAALGRYFDQMHSLAAAQIFSAMARSMHSGDVSFSQINVLFCLYGQGAQRIADLAQGAHLSQCAVSRLVSRLVREGLVEKELNPANRRERLIRLAPAGLTFLKELQRTTAAAYENLFQQVPPALTQRLLDILEEILPLLPPPELTA